MRYRFYTVDVFTDRLFGGNRLAVLLQAQGLADEQMQAIAREFNLSETAFVFPPDDAAHACRLRIFTPVTELPFAGHPTVGSAYVLVASGRLPLQGASTEVVLEERAGPVAMSISAKNRRPIHVRLRTPQLPEIGPAPASRELAEALGSAETDIRCGEHAPRTVSCGLPWVIVPVVDRGSIARARVRPDRWASMLGEHWARGVYLVAFDSPAANADLHARMSAPSIARQQDPATGSAAASLAAYLAALEPDDGVLSWRISQGHEMGRPSLIDIQVEKERGAVQAVYVGGASVLVSEGVIEVPPV
jgi:trans-2,3-dihydro-3-hydroxyanthranilate isomerase